MSYGRGWRIHIDQLELMARIGVPDEERATEQRLTVSITLWPLTPKGQSDDDISQTVDYAVVCDETKKFIASRRDKLVETLADAVAEHLLQFFPLQRIEVELRKFILPEVEFVSVTVTRERSVE